MKVGRKIRSLRESAGIPVQQAAARSGISRQYWYMIEEDKHNPSIRTLDRMASALGLSVVDLIAEKVAR
uniref:Putative DNA binding, helix-turn-helix domain containing protein n=1 Tax=viral metagenome TaxID=1070528 RepID=A0A6M3JLY0_9ZZZZ